MFLNLQKNRSQKLSMLEEKQNYRSWFSIFGPNFSCRSKVQKIIFLKIPKVLFENLPSSEKKSENWKSRSIVLCRIQCTFQKCLCFYSSIGSFWLLFLWKLKKKKKTRTKKKKKKKKSKISNFIENHTEIQRFFTNKIELELRSVYK